MQPVIQNLPPRTVIGLGAPFISVLSPERNNHIVIPRVWDDFTCRIGDVPGRVNQEAMGCVYCRRAQGPDAGCFYFACVEVAPGTPAPDGLERRELPGGRHAVFTHKGRLDTIGQTMAAIYGGWLPGSGERMRNAPDLELYGARFNPASDESEFEICLPLE